MKKLILISLIILLSGCGVLPCSEMKWNPKVEFGKFYTVNQEGFFKNGRFLVLGQVHIYNSTGCNKPGYKGSLWKNGASIETSIPEEDLVIDK